MCIIYLELGEIHYNTLNHSIEGMKIKTRDFKI